MMIAGETSGDALGADLMQALGRRQSDIMVTGIGGSKMIDEGLASIFPLSEIAVMGLERFCRAYRNCLSVSMKLLLMHWPLSLTLWC